MKQLKEMPRITEDALAGLVADDRLKYRILNAARDRGQPQRRSRLVPVIAAVLVLCLAVGLPAVLRRPQEQVVRSMAAGSATEAPGLLTGGIGGGTVGAAAGSAGKLWEESSGGSFPIIGVEKRYYRMSKSPCPAGLCGRQIGKINEFTTEPALTDGKTLMSNIVPVGTAVYEAQGMGGAAVIAQVSGEYRLFQRVSFNGMSVRDKETLRDTLKAAGHVTALELSGRGKVTDPARVRALTDLLLQSAVFESSAQLSSDQTLILTLDNGLRLQLLVRNDKLSACGTWSCPEFFEAFEE